MSKTKRTDKKVAVVDYESAVGEAPRRTLLYLGTRALDRVDTPEEVLSRTHTVCGYIGSVIPSIAPEHRADFLSTAAHVLQALTVRLRHIEEDAEADRLRRPRGGI